MVDSDGWSAEVVAAVLLKFREELISLVRVGVPLLGVKHDHGHRDDQHGNEETKPRRRGVLEDGHEREPAAGMAGFPVKVGSRVEQQHVARVPSWRD